MSRRNLSPPKNRHYRPKDLAVVRIDGRDYYLGRHGSPESREKYARLVAEHAASSVAPPTPRERRVGPDVGPTVDEVVFLFWNPAAHYRRADGSPTCVLDNWKLVLGPIRRLYGSTPAAEFGTKSLKAVRQAMVDSGLARTTVNHRIGKVRQLFEWAVAEDLVPRP